MKMTWWLQVAHMHVQAAEGLHDGAHRRDRHCRVGLLGTRAQGPAHLLPGRPLTHVHDGLLLGHGGQLLSNLPMPPARCLRQVLTACRRPQHCELPAQTAPRELLEDPL